MTYIDALPKELKNELQYFRNNIYRLILNRIYELQYVVGNNPDELTNIYLKLFLTPYIIPHVKYVPVYQKLNDSGSYIYYHQIPNTQLITRRIFLEFANSNTSRFGNSTPIKVVNNMLSNYGHAERLMDYHNRLVLVVPLDDY